MFWLGSKTTATSQTMSCTSSPNALDTPVVSETSIHKKMGETLVTQSQQNITNGTDYNNSAQVSLDSSVKGVTDIPTKADTETAATSASSTTSETCSKLPIGVPGDVNPVYSSRTQPVNLKEMTLIESGVNSVNNCISTQSKPKEKADDKKKRKDQRRKKKFRHNPTLATVTEHKNEKNVSIQPVIEQSKLQEDNETISLKLRLNATTKSNTLLRAQISQWKLVVKTILDLVGTDTTDVIETKPDVISKIRDISKSALMGGRAFLEAVAGIEVDNTHSMMRGKQRQRTIRPSKMLKPLKTGSQTVVEKARERNGDNDVDFLNNKIKLRSLHTTPDMHLHNTIRSSNIHTRPIQTHYNINTNHSRSAGDLHSHHLLQSYKSSRSFYPANQGRLLGMKYGNNTQQTILSQQSPWGKSAMRQALLHQRPLGQPPMISNGNRHDLSRFQLNNNLVTLDDRRMGHYSPNKCLKQRQYYQPVQGFNTLMSNHRDNHTSNSSGFPLITSPAQSDHPICVRIREELREAKDADSILRLIEQADNHNITDLAESARKRLVKLLRPNSVNKSNNCNSHYLNC